MSGQSHEATMEVAELLIAHGLQVFGITSMGLPHANCLECKRVQATDKAAHLADCSCLLCHGFYSATDDLERVREMVKAKPYTLLAIRTGLVSGVMVIDFDNHVGGANGLPFFEEWRDGGKLPPTWKVKTGGGGIHLYYRVDSDWPTRPGFVPGVDIKSSGGYVVAPGFKKLGKDRYEGFPGRGVGECALADAPAWLTDALSKPTASAVMQARSGPSGRTSKAEGLEVLQRRLGAALTRLRDAPPGESNRLLFALACRAGEAWSGGAITSEDDVYAQAFLILESRKDHAEIVKTWQSGFGRGMADFNVKGARP